MRPTPQVRRAQIGADDAGMRLDNYLLSELRNVPRSHVYRIIRSGEVRVNGGRVRPATRLHTGDEVRIPPVHQAARPTPGRAPEGLLAQARAAVVEQSEDWLLVAKPPGLAVHAGTGLRFGVIELLRLARDEPGLELVHRLDRDTSGALLLARNRTALNRLRGVWRKRQVEKDYLALVVGTWVGGERALGAPLARDILRGGERISAVAEHGKAAHSVFLPRERFRHTSLMAVRIATGRSHQIRVHAAHLGHPVAGDDKYGDREANKRLRSAGLGRMFLHAWRLQIPATGEIWQAPLPPELESILTWLREHHAL